MRKTKLQISGGLGNQIFQYHAGFLFSEIYENELCLDFSRINTDITFRNRLELGMRVQGIQGFCLPRGKILGANYLSRVTNSNQVNKLFDWTGFSRLHDFSKNGEIGEDLKASNFFGLKEGKRTNRLKGYFQSLDLVSEAIRRGSLSELKLVNENTKLSSEISRLSSRSTLAIHVRLTDYLTQASSNLSNSDYYMEAFKLVSLEQEFDEIFIFSDDIELCRKILPSYISNKVTSYISQKEFSDAESMILMSNFRALIISNSTFSYFAALYGKPGIKVVAPDPWFETENSLVRFNFPEAWTTITL